MEDYIEFGSEIADASEDELLEILEEILEEIGLDMIDFELLKVNYCDAWVVARSVLQGLLAITKRPLRKLAIKAAIWLGNKIAKAKGCQV
ncbi:hypothetical protein [Martelella sp. FOR1707]